VRADIRKCLGEEIKEERSRNSIAQTLKELQAQPSRGEKEKVAGIELVRYPVQVM
jgi:hypothetical protein